MRKLLRAFLMAAAMISVGAAFQSAAAADEVEKAVDLARELAGDATAQAKPEAARPAQVKAEPDGSGPEQPRFPGVEIRHLVRGGDGAPSVSIYYPAVGNEKIDAELKERAERIADAFLKDQAEEASEEDKPDSSGNWEETAFYTVERPGPNVISIVFNIYSYTGGAHGMVVIEALNYDLKTGAPLGLADLFGKPEKALEIMSELTQERLRKSLGEDVEEDMLRDGTAPDAANFSALSLLPNGVAVEFQPYQVGPWAIGQQRVELTLEELAPAEPSPLVWPPKAIGQESVEK